MALRSTRLALLAALVVAGCGGGSDSSGSQPAAPANPKASRSDTEVIRRWSATLSRGNAREAAAFFAVPSTAANNTPPIVLGTPALVRDFNAALPCGARLLRTTRRAQYTVATFRLTERPGGNCGRGVGGTAATAFRIRDGKIVEWLRVDVPPGKSPPEPEAPRERPAPSETV